MKYKDRLTKPLIYAILLLAVIIAISQTAKTTANESQKSALIEPQMTFDEAVKAGHFKYSKLADSICGIDQQGTDTWCRIASGKDDNELYENDNYYRLYLEDSTILLVDNLTGKTVADISNDALLQNIILQDNQ